jgi:hypothetical protein
MWECGYVGVSLAGMVGEGAQRSSGSGYRLPINALVGLLLILLQQQGIGVHGKPQDACMEYIARGQLAPKAAHVTPRYAESTVHAREGKQRELLQRVLHGPCATVAKLLMAPLPLVTHAGWGHGRWCCEVSNML